MGAGAEVEIVGAQPDQLGDAQPRLHSDEQHGVVTPPGPCYAIGCRQQRVDFRWSQEIDECPLETLGLDSQHTGDAARMLGMTQSSVAKQRVNGRKPRIARSRSIATVQLEVIQKCPDERDVNVAKV